MTPDYPPLPGAPDLSVSVVISTKNRAVLLADALRGLAAQTLGKDRFEVIVVDNLSTEDIRSLVEKARAEWGLSIRYHRMESDRGPSPSRNRGVALARAPIIAFTDSDCCPHPDWLREGLAAMGEEIDMVSGAILYKPGQKAGFFSKLSAERTWEHPGYPAANLFFRRRVFLDHGGFDEHLSFRDPFDRAVECADTDLAWRIIDAGHRKAFAPEALVYHEIETLTPWLWLIEPTRLFVLPLLVRKHPELRGKLLRWRFVFYRGTLWIYLLCLLVPAIAATDPNLLWLAVPLLLVKAALKAGVRSARAFFREVAKSIPDIARMAVMAATLVYGSVRYRCLVL